MTKNLCNNSMSSYHICQERCLVNMAFHGQFQHLRIYGSTYIKSAVHSQREYWSHLQRLSLDEDKPKVNQVQIKKNEQVTFKCLCMNIWQLVIFVPACYKWRANMHILKNAIVAEKCIIITCKTLKNMQHITIKYLVKYLRCQMFGVQH